MRDIAVIGIGFGLLAQAGLSAADAQTITPRIEIHADFAAASDLERLAQRRLTAKPSLRARLSRSLTLNLAGRLELADDDTGLGDLSGYSDASRPLIDEDDTRLEIDTATLAWRAGRTRITAGKQTVAWGALDGLRVTDAFNPIRLREGVAIPNRPDRISLWGLRVRAPIAGYRLDAAFAPDPTVNQIAAPGEAFAPTAPRFRGGLPASAPLPALQRDDRDNALEDAVAGLRIGRDIAGLEAHVAIVSGPQHDPVLRSPTPGAPVVLAHDRRTLIGVDAVKTLGPVIARAEAAIVPEERFNTVTSTSAGPVLGEVARGRWLAGVGADWNAPADVFFNAQLAVDYVGDAPSTLVRPATDVIATLRAQRGFHNDATELRAELLAALRDGDGVWRLDVARTITDAVNVVAGADIFFGDRGGLFGQYRDVSRLRFGLRIAQ